MDWRQCPLYHYILVVAFVEFSKRSLLRTIPHNMCGFALGSGLIANAINAVIVVCVFLGIGLGFKVVYLGTSMMQMISIAVCSSVSRLS